MEPAEGSAEKLDRMEEVVVVAEQNTRNSDTNLRKAAEAVKGTC